MKEAERHLPIKHRVAAAAQGWLWRYAKRRIRRELHDYRQPPEIRRGPLLGLRRHRPQPQVFRSLVQINFYPRDSGPEGSH